LNIQTGWIYESCDNLSAIFTRLKLRREILLTVVIVQCSSSILQSWLCLIQGMAELISSKFLIWSFKSPINPSLVRTVSYSCIFSFSIRSLSVYMFFSFSWRIENCSCWFCVFSFSIWFFFSFFSNNLIFSSFWNISSLNLKIASLC